MVRVCAAVVVLLGNGLDHQLPLLLGPFDVEVAVGLATQVVTLMSRGTSALHDEVDSLSLVANDEADVLGLDVELPNNLALSHDLCLFASVWLLC